MTPEFERELRLMGVMPVSITDKVVQGDEHEVNPRAICLTKGYFNDPRDQVTGEVKH